MSNQVPKFNAREFVKANYSNQLLEMQMECITNEKLSVHIGNDCILMNFKSKFGDLSQAIWFNNQFESLTEEKVKTSMSDMLELMNLARGNING